MIKTCSHFSSAHNKIISVKLRHFVIQSENQNQSSLGHSDFPALCVSYTYLLQVFIGTLDCMCRLRFVCRVTFLGLVSYDTPLQTVLSIVF